MVKRRRTVDDWRQAVFKSTRIKDNARVLLLYLADHMKADRTVSIPRKTIASDLGKSERRITERIAAAHEAGFLSTVAAGYRGRTAVYQGLFPTPQSGTHARPLSTRDSGTILSPLSSAETRPLFTQESGTDGGPTTTTADLTPVGHRRNGSTYETHADTPASSDLTPCGFHGIDGLPCPEDCRNHPDARRTA